MRSAHKRSFIRNTLHFAGAGDEHLVAVVLSNACRSIHESHLPRLGSSPPCARQGVRAWNISTCTAAHRSAMCQWPSPRPPFLPSPTSTSPVCARPPNPLLPIKAVVLYPTIEGREGKIWRKHQCVGHGVAFREENRGPLGFYHSLVRSRSPLCAVFGGEGSRRAARITNENGGSGGRVWPRWKGAAPSRSRLVLSSHHLPLSPPPLFFPHCSAPPSQGAHM